MYSLLLQGGMFASVLDTGKGLRCALIRCTLGPGKSKKGWDFGGEGTKGAMGDKGSSLQATWERGGRLLSQLEGAK